MRPAGCTIFDQQKKLGKSIWRTELSAFQSIKWPSMELAQRIEEAKLQAFGSPKTFAFSLRSSGKQGKFSLRLYLKYVSNLEESLPN